MNVPEGENRLRNPESSNNVPFSDRWYFVLTRTQFAHRRRYVAEKGACV